MVDEIAIARTALGAACAIFDTTGRVLLVHHTYGRLNLELPGGLALPTPISDFTERRIRDALSDAPVAVVRVGTRQWRE